MSNNNKTEVRGGGIGFCGLLTILFIGLKLTGNITWSWWWVLSPLWIPIGLVISVMLVALTIGGIAMMVTKE
jgi:hypothetical protein